MTVYAPTSIDLSRLPPPDAIEALDFETMLAAFKTRFLAYWDAQRVIDPTLPAYNTIELESDPAAIVGQAWSYVRLMDRARVNDGIKALLGPLATGSNLENLVASRNIERQTVTPATGDTPAVMEGDVALLRRYLLSYDVPCAGSAGRYLFDAWTAWPQSEDKTLGLWDARVNGRAVHGRRGDTDVVIIGPMGRAPTTAELATVRAAVTAATRAPEATAISVMAATRVEYTVSIVLEVPGVGPSAETIQAEAFSRVTAAAIERMLIAGEIPDGLLAGAAYGSGVIRVRDLAPVVIEPDPYTVPVLAGVTITTEVR